LSQFLLFQVGLNPGAHVQLANIWAFPQQLAQFNAGPKFQIKECLSLSWRRFNFYSFESMEKKSWTCWQKIRDLLWHKVHFLKLIDLSPSLNFFLTKWCWLLLVLLASSPSNKGCFDNDIPAVGWILIFSCASEDCLTRLLSEI